MTRLYEKIDEIIDLSFNESDVITIIIDRPVVTINYDLKNGDYKILIFNNTDGALSLKEKGSIKNSHVEINYLELNNDTLFQDCDIEVGKNSSLDILTTYLGVNDKKIDFRLVDAESDSLINIANNVVCLNDADFVLNIVGKIVKGAKRSKCFQKSRCLTMESPKAAKVLPVLEIDENDVEASHSLSSGTIDEDVLFYMNSRGLDQKAALKLMLESYLIPDSAFYKPYEKGDEIEKIALKKVEKICLI